MKNKLIITLGFLGLMSGLHAADSTSGETLEVHTPSKGSVSLVGEAATPEMVTAPLGSPWSEKIQEAIVEDVSKENEQPGQMTVGEFVERFMGGYLTFEEIEQRLCQINLWGELFLHRMWDVFEASRSREGCNFFSTNEGKWYCIVLVYMTQFLEPAAIYDYAQIFSPEGWAYFLEKLEIYCCRETRSVLEGVAKYCYGERMCGRIERLRNSRHAYWFIVRAYSAEGKEVFNDSFSQVKARLPSIPE